MRRNKHRVTAFTIMELTIAMLLSALVIAITYTAYSIMSKSYANFTSKNEEMAVLLRVDELMKKDLQHADIITGADHIIIFSDTARTIKYIFNADEVIRQALITDTFKVKPLMLETAFENNELNTTGLTKVEAPVIDDIAFKLIFRGDTVSCHYHKNYSSQTLIKATTHAID